MNIHTELENFVARISSTFSQELPSILHPHSSNLRTIEKIARASIKVFPFDATGKSLSHSGSEENLALKKRLSQLGEDASKLPEETISTEKPSDQPEKEHKSPRTSISEKVVPSLTPIKSVTYKIPSKENSFTATQSWFKEEFNELSFQTQMISVHNNLSVGDLVSVNGSPYRIIHKEWNFPNDIVQMENIFTGERIEEVHHSRLNAMMDQIITKKYQVIKISSKKIIIC